MLETIDPWIEVLGYDQIWEDETTPDLDTETSESIID